MIYSPLWQFSEFNPLLPTLTKWHSASSASSLLDHEKRVTCWQAEQPFRGTFASCKNGLIGISGHSAKANAKSCTCNEVSLCQSTGWGSSVGKDLRVLVDNELNMSQKWALAATQNCISKGVAWMLREVIISICSTPMRLHLKCCEQVWVLIIREVLTKWRESGVRALQCLRAAHYAKQGEIRCSFNLDKIRWDLSFYYLKWGLSRRWSQTLLEDVLWKANSQKLQKGKLYLNIRRFAAIRVAMLWNRDQRDSGVSDVGDFQHMPDKVMSNLHLLTGLTGSLLNVKQTVFSGTDRWFVTNMIACV